MENATKANPEEQPDVRGFGPEHHESPGELGDFTVTWRVIPISLLAIVIGAIAAVVALALLRLIGLFTNLFFYQRWSFALSSPAGHHLGALVIFIPVIGALIVGVMARYGSERIRGHGIPDALEAILINGSIERRPKIRNITNAGNMPPNQAPLNADKLYRSHFLLLEPSC